MKKWSLFFPALLFLLCRPLLSAPGSLIYLDNQPFQGYSFREYQQVFLELEEIKRIYPALSLLQSKRDDSVSLNNIPFSSLKRKSINGRLYYFISAREFAQIAGGRYEFNPQTGILDIYTFQLKPVKMENARFFLNRHYFYPAIVQDVSKALAQNLGLSAEKVPVEISFLSPSEIKEKGGADVIGFTENTVLNHRLLFSKVYIEDQVPTQIQVYALAHELAHVWYAQYRPDSQQGLELRTEGFAEWIAYKVMKALHYSDSDMAGFRPASPVYLEGFELYTKLENKYGYSTVLESIKQGQDLE